jgi:hypothetical protein
MQDVTAVAEDVSSYDFYNPAGSTPPTIQPPSTISATRLELLDLPAFPTDGVTDAYLRYGVVGLGDGWSGSAVYRSDDGGANYALMQTVTAQATLGAVLNIIPAGTIYAWDDITTIDVLLTFGELQSVTDLAVLNGANACVIANEVIQFGTATLLDTNKYRLSHLLRGRLGTEWAVGGHVAGERFVLLTNARTMTWDGISLFSKAAVACPVLEGNSAPKRFLPHPALLAPWKVGREIFRPTIPFSRPNFSKPRPSQLLHPKTRPPQRFHTRPFHIFTQQTF